MNSSDSYICDAEEFGFDCTYPNCSCAEDNLEDILDLDVILEESDDAAYEEPE